ncbi:DUF4184 domain-containing protein [Nocardioides silvaticus]|uniref:DUF4184 domain-containing protein n=1 Tax=Nocardioides silvaticus TaxID=2201891 RepID=A0A316TH27_9ACTN|nr:DUF4184 family protein [Nocardioides silvaticus]PWN01654.1 DUF4184 domain-containing protein [Nocardioides silvaticus]
MPVTLAHPAAILPLRRIGLPVSAMVAGAMVPDIPLFVWWIAGYDATHSLVGILLIDPVVVTGVLLGWFLLVRDAAVDLAPGPVRARLAERARLTTRQWLLVPVGGAVGAATHLAWDSFTHPGRWGPDHIEWLRAEHAGLEGLRWAQYVSGVVGMAIVVWAVVAHLRSLPPLAEPRRARALPAPTLPAVVLASLGIGVVSTVRSVPEGFHVMAFNGVVDSLTAVVLLGAATCAVWQAVRLRQPRVPAQR